jgi:hypothetical protein
MVKCVQGSELLVGLWKSDRFGAMWGQFKAVVAVMRFEPPRWSPQARWMSAKYKSIASKGVAMDPMMKYSSWFDLIVLS